MWIFKKRFPRTGPRPKPPVVRSSPNIAGFETQETTETRVDEGRQEIKMQSELSKTQMYCSELHFPTEVLATNWQFPLFGHVLAVTDSFLFHFVPVLVELWDVPISFSQMSEVSRPATSCPFPQKFPRS